MRQTNHRRDNGKSVSSCGREIEHVSIYLGIYMSVLCILFTNVCLSDSLSAEQTRGEGMHAWLASRTAIIHFTNELGNNTTLRACSPVVRPALRALRPLSSNH